MTVKKTEIMKFEDPMLVTLFSLTKNVKSFQGNSQDIFLCLLCEQKLPGEKVNTVPLCMITLFHLVNYIIYCLAMLGRALQVAMSGSPLLWSRPKYFNNCRLD